MLTSDPRGPAIAEAAASASSTRLETSAARAPLRTHAPTSRRLPICAESANSNRSLPSRRARARLGLAGQDAGVRAQRRSRRAHLEARVLAYARLGDHEDLQLGPHADPAFERLDPHALSLRPLATDDRRAPTALAADAHRRAARRLH